MLPWLGVLAGTLATKMGSADKRQAAAGEILSKDAARMGGDTSAVDAAIANKNINNQESQQLSNLFIQQLVGKLGQPQASTPGSDPSLGATAGNTGLKYEGTVNAAGAPVQRMVPGMGVMGEGEDPYGYRPGGWRR
jgi:hypothetical protein